MQHERLQDIYKIYDELCKDTGQNHVHAVSLERRKKRTKKEEGNEGQ